VAPAGGREDSSAAAAAEVVGASSELSTIVLRFGLFKLIRAPSGNLDFPARWFISRYNLCWNVL
jgi:hypothetical protein